MSILFIIPTKHSKILKLLKLWSELYSYLRLQLIFYLVLDNIGILRNNVKLLSVNILEASSNFKHSNNESLLINMNIVLLVYQLQTSRKLTPVLFWFGKAYWVKGKDFSFMPFFLKF